MIRIACAATALFALAACGTGPDRTEEPTISDKGDQPMVPGLYAIESDAVVYSRTRLNEDGSYTDFDGGNNVVGGGQWSSDGAQICFDPAGDGENEQESCWINEAPGADGSFVTRLVDGDTSYLVRPLDE